MGRFKRFQTNLDEIFMIEETIRPKSFRDEGDERTYMFFVNEHGPYTVRIGKEDDKYRVDFSYLNSYVKGADDQNPMTVLKKVAERVKHHMSDFGNSENDYYFPTVDKKRERVFRKFISREFQDG